MHGMKLSMLPVTKVLSLSMVCNNFVFANPFVYNRTTGAITISRCWSLLIPFFAFVRTTVYTLHRFNTIDAEHELNPYLIISFIRGILVILYQTIYTVELLCRRRDFKQMVEEIHNLYLVLRVDGKQLKMLYWRTIAILVVFSVCLIGLGLILAVLQEYINIWNLIPLLLYTQFLCFPYALDTQFAVLLNFVIIGLDTIRNRCKILSSDNGFFKSMSYEYLPLVYRINSEDLAPRNVSELRLLCRRLYRLKDDIAAHYKARLSATAIVTFCDVVFFSFANIIFSQVGAENAEKLLFVADGWVFINVTKLLMMTGVGQKTETAAKNLATYIHELITPQSSREANIELFALSQELLHRSPSVNAGGYFPLNDSLIIAIGSATVMYIVILIQFKFEVKSGGSLGPVESLLFFFG